MVISYLLQRTTIKQILFPPDAGKQGADAARCIFDLHPPCPCPRQTKFVFVYMCNAYYVCSVKFDGKESYWKQVCRLVPAACDSEVKSRRSDRKRWVSDQPGSRARNWAALAPAINWSSPSFFPPPPISFFLL